MNQNSKTIIDDAGLGNVATDVLVRNIDAQTIAGGQGVDPNDLSEFVTLVLRIVDMTGSMGGVRNAVIQAYEQSRRALMVSKKGEDILMSTWLFNSNGTKLVNGFLTLELLPPLDQVYQPGGMTNLFDAIIDGINGLLEYEALLFKNGTRSQVVVSILTDGYDNASRHTAADVKAVVEALLAKEKYIFSLVGFDVEKNSGKTPQELAAELGIPASNVLKAGSSDHDVRLAMGQESKSIIRTSQTVIGSQSQSGFYS